MEKCIYLGKKHDLTFKGREHIIPACIGGKEKLPEGFVSDQANNLFSKLEAEFSRNNPLIAIPRIFLGPGKRGSLSEKKQTKSSVLAMELVGSDETSLGIIKKGKPISVFQVYLSKSNNDRVE